jgi:hypothetical protein
MHSDRVEANAPVRPLLSTVLSGGCLLLAIALPAFGLYTAIFEPQMIIDGLNLSAPPRIASGAELTQFQRVALAVLSCVSPLFQAYGLNCARRCFQSFVRGEYFTLQVVAGLRGFAAGVFFSIVAGLLATPLLSVLLTLNAGPGNHTLAVNVSSQQVLTLLFAGVLWQIAGVMTNAVRLAEENSQFV